jgi:hypothetical protein
MHAESEGDGGKGGAKATEPAMAAIWPSRPGPEETWACVGAEVVAGGARAECAFWVEYAAVAAPREGALAGALAAGREIVERERDLR